MSNKINKLEWAKAIKSHNKTIKRLLIGAKAAIKATDKVKKAQ
jgi:hypothetical protein